MWLAESLSALTIVFKDTHRFAAAADHYQQALVLSEYSATSCSGSAVTVRQSMYYVSPLAICEERYGDRHYEVAIVEHNLAALYAAQGQYKQAERAYREVLEINKQILGVQHPDVVALRSLIHRLR